MGDNVLLTEYKEFYTEKPFDFKKHSAIGCGAFAETGFYPRTVEELQRLVNRLKTDEKTFVTVGNMTNVLPSDLPLEKSVICTKKLTDIRFIGECVYVEAGVTSGALLRACKRERKSGAEFLIGIPCTLGGALYMNAGAGGRYIAEIVDSVSVYRSGSIVKLSLRDCKYAYKSSVFMDTQDVIIGATLRLQTATEKDIATREKYWQSKRAHLPRGRSMGCVFKNPKGESAGELIDRSGLKGLRVGDAVVSKQHANFIINEGRATERQIRTLIAIIKNTVFSRFGVMLEEEIRYLT